MNSQLKDKKRTIQQNSALHLWFEELAQTLNIAGLDMRKVLKPGIDILWTKESIKEYLWRPIQKAMYQKNSTTQLLKHEEIDKIYGVLHRHLTQTFKTEIPEFPSWENMDIQENVDR